MPFYIKSKFGHSEAYYTGEFDRSYPPCPYLSKYLAEAASWETREAAQEWADQYDGEVVEISDAYLRDMNIIGSVTYNDITVEGLEVDGEDIIVTLRVKNAKAHANGKWSWNTKMSLEVFKQ